MEWGAGKNRGFTLVASADARVGHRGDQRDLQRAERRGARSAPIPGSGPARVGAAVNGEGRTRGIPLDITDSWRKEGKTLTDVAHALMGQANFTVTGPGGAERVLLEQVDFYTLQLLGVWPLIGRWFQPDEVIVQGNTSQTIVISYGMWQRIFGGDPDVIGKKVPGFSAGWGDVIMRHAARVLYPPAAVRQRWLVCDHAAIPGGSAVSAPASASTRRKRNSTGSCAATASSA